MRKHVPRYTCLLVLCLAAFVSVEAQGCGISNCLSCFQGGGSCTTCAGGFTLKKDNCVSCPQGCLQCNEDRKCLKCANGMDLTLAGNCCSFGCRKCAGADRCVECREGFRIDYSYTSCIKCDPGCKKCTRVFSLTGGFNSKCIECEDGWYYVSGICQKFIDASWNLWGGIFQTFGMFLSMGTVFYLMCCGMPECLKCKRNPQQAQPQNTPQPNQTPIIIQLTQPNAPQQSEPMQRTLVAVQPEPRTVANKSHPSTVPKVQPYQKLQQQEEY